MDAQLPGAPELPGDSEKPKHAGQYSSEAEAAKPVAEAKPGTPQLIKSTPSSLPPEPEDEELGDEAEEDELNEHVDYPGDPDGVVAAEEEQNLRAGQAAAMAAEAKRRHPVLKLLLVIIVLAALVIGGYWYSTHRHKTPAKAAQQTSQKTQSTQQATTPTKHYDSTNFTLGFDYPQNWTVNDTTSKLTVTSPAQKLTGASGQTTDAQVVVTIQNQQSTIPGYPSGGATASLASDRLSYKKPTSIQRAQTYVSYLGYASQSSLNAIYVTGDNGYQQGQDVPMSDIVKATLLVGVNFMNCPTSGCDNGTPVTLSANSWKSSTASTQVANLIESLQLN